MNSLITAMDEKTLRETTSQKKGIILQPRMPDTIFTEDLPRIHSGNLGATFYNNIFSIGAGIGEKYFIRIGDMMVSVIESEKFQIELNDFVRQEATHAAVHARMNKILEKQGLPVAQVEAWVDAVFCGMHKAGGYPKLVMLGVVGEQVFGIIGEGFLKQHKTLETFHPAVAEILLWHGYEELEHSAAIYDGYIEMLGDEKRAHRWRLTSIPYMLFLMMLGFPVLMFALLRNEGKGEVWKLKNWVDFYHYVLGKNGVVNGAGKQALAYCKKSFHPWDYTTAPAMLQEYKRFAKPEWNMPAKPLRFSPEKGKELKAAIDAPDPSLFQEMISFLKFCGFMFKASWILIRDTSPKKLRAV